MSRMMNASDERRKVGMLVPPPILLLALVVACVGAHAFWRAGFTFSATRDTLGSLLLVASVALIASCARMFKKAGTPFRPTSPSTAIVTEGPYRISRNPMYLGMAGLLAGLGVLLGSYCFGAALVMFLVVVHFGVVLPEERYLESVQGEAYRRYKRRTRRWL